LIIFDPTTLPVHLSLAEEGRKILQVHHTIAVQVHLAPALAEGFHLTWPWGHGAKPMAMAVGFFSLQQLGISPTKMENMT